MLRRFSGACRADESDRLPLARRKAHILEDVVGGVWVFEAHVVETHGAFKTGLAGFLGAVDDSGLGVENLVDALRRDLRTRQEDEHHHHHHESHDDLHCVGGEDHHVGEERELVRHACGADERCTDPVDGQAQSVHDEVDGWEDDRHAAAGEELGIGELVVGVVEFLLLVAFGVVGAHHAQARQVLEGDAADIVRQRLHLLELGHDEDEDDGEHHQEDCRCHAGCDGPVDAFACDFYDCPYGCNGRLDDDLQPHNDEQLDLGHVVGGTCDETRGGEAIDLLHREGVHLPELQRTQCLGERCGNARTEECHQNRGHQAAERTQQHVAAGLPDVCHLGVRRFHQSSDLCHIVRQLQVEPHLNHDERKTECGLEPLHLAHVLEYLEHNDP
jgi:hypothetical protein